jgi:glycosyltransferase involved in cell wall biosynthesis
MDRRSGAYSSSPMHLRSSRSFSLRSHEAPNLAAAPAPSVPTVSVVVPTRDRRALLLPALRSVLAQTSIDLEVIVVDDGSTDDTQGAVRSLRDPRVGVMRHETPRGVAMARNAGAAATHGTWIALLDDDDLWAPDKLVKQVAAAQEAGARWVYAGAVEIDEAGRLLGGERPPPPAFLVKQLTRRNVMPAGSSNVMVHAETFRSSEGFDAGLRHLADWDMWLRLAGLGHPACVHEPLVAYRIHPAQATLDTRGMMAEAQVLHDRHGADLNSIRRWLAWSQLRRGRRREAVGAYARAVASGDLASVGRVAVAALHPRPTAVRGRASADEDLEWLASARAWVRAASVD